jgi:hypothetical protein
MAGEQQVNGIPLWIHPITWLTVILGWVIVNWQNNRREERKEIRTALTQISSDIDALTNLAIEYHTSSRRAYKLEVSIIIKERQLSEKLSFLRLRNSAYSNQYTSFADAITLENFETTSFKKQSQYSQIIESIRDAASDLISALELEYSELFRSGAFIRIFAYWRQQKEQEGLLGALIAFSRRNQEGIMFVFIYIGLLTLGWWYLKFVEQSMQSIIVPVIRV